MFTIQPTKKLVCGSLELKLSWQSKTIKVKSVKPCNDRENYIPNFDSRPNYVRSNQTLLCQANLMANVSHTYRFQFGQHLARRNQFQPAPQASKQVVAWSDFDGQCLYVDHCPQICLDQRSIASEAAILSLVSNRFL